MATETVVKTDLGTEKKPDTFKVEIKSEAERIEPPTVTAELCAECQTDEPDEWIQCDTCGNWYHMGCLDDPRVSLRELVVFHCPQCESKHGPSVKAESRKRRKTRLNYAALNNGIVQIENTHSHVQYFKAGNFPSAQFPEVEAFDGVIDTPTVVRAAHFSNLGMTTPSNLTPRIVARSIGEDHPVWVMDVVTQNTLPGWTAGKWATYFETPKEERSQILNVISLEFTGTPLERLVKRPTYVAEQDLVDTVWPKDAALERPKVKYYCLMGAADSYTDFHVDFAGSSVFYHVISGHKTFAFVRPTKRNLTAYESWCKREDQASTLFAKLADECVTVDVKDGDTMIIPAGWIHAVYTPEDSVVIGGNFLTLRDFELQLQIVALEKRTKVLPKFTFPKFRATMWYAADYLVNRMKDSNTSPPQNLRRLLKQFLGKTSGAPKNVDAQRVLDSL